MGKKLTDTIFDHICRDNHPLSKCKMLGQKFYFVNYDNLGKPSKKKKFYYILSS